MCPMRKGLMVGHRMLVLLLPREWRDWRTEDVFPDKGHLKATFQQLYTSQDSHPPFTHHYLML